MMVMVVKRRSLGKRNNLSKILSSMREYYGARASEDEYVQFYSNWLKGEGPFSDPEYKMGYDKVAKILTGLIDSRQLIIDVGCGVGTWSILMAKGGARVISLDYSLDVVLKCGKRSRDLNVETMISRILGDGSYIPFKEDVFDGASLNWVLAHIPVARTREFMKGVGRVLRGGAWLMISDSYWRGQEGGKEQVQTRKTSTGLFEVYKYYYTPVELQNLLNYTFGEVVYLETTPYEMLCVARKYKN